MANSGFEVLFGSATEWTVYHELFKSLEMLEALLERNFLRRTSAGIPEIADMVYTHSAEVKS